MDTGNCVIKNTREYVLFQWLSKKKKVQAMLNPILCSYCGSWISHTYFFFFFSLFAADCVVYRCAGSPIKRKPQNPVFLHSYESVLFVSQKRIKVSSLPTSVVPIVVGGFRDIHPALMELWNNMKLRITVGSSPPILFYTM